MTYDFVKPKKIGGLDTNTHAGQKSPFASRPFLATPRSQPQPQDIQTMRERGARYQAANPHLYNTQVQPQTVQRQASETEEESLQMKANESVQKNVEQPDLQTLIRQRAARVDTPLQRMMKVQMAEAQGLEQEKDDLQMRQESSVQREAMPEEQEEKKPEDIQAKTEPQPEDLEKEEDISPVQAKAESQPEDLDNKKPEDIQSKFNSTVQAQEDLDKEKPEDLQAKADSQPEDLEEEDSTPVQTKAEPTETLEEETKLQEKQELNVLSQSSQQEEEVELQQKVNQAIQQQKLHEQKKDAQLQTRIDRSIQRQKLNQDRDQGHLQQQINHAVQHQELEKQQEETQLQGRINRAIQKQKAREDDDLLKAPPAKTHSVRPKSFQTKLQNKLQTKLTVGKPGDKYEQEADKVAAKVMAMPETEQKTPQETELVPKQEEPEVQMRSLSDSITSVGQGQLTGEPQSIVQNKEGQSSTQPGLENRLASQQGQGSPLPDKTRNFMESRFGADFGNVRVHTDSQSVQMNKELGAQAFTHGNDVYFNSGKFNPGSSSGKELLAHELTHTIQQTGGVQAKLINKKAKKENKIQAKAVFPVQRKEATVQEEVKKASPDSLDNLEKNQQAGNSETSVAKEEKNQSSPQSQDIVAPEVNAAVTENSTSPQEKGGEVTQEAANAKAETPLNQETKATDAGSGENPGNNQETKPPESGNQIANGGGNQGNTAKVPETTTQETAPVTPDSDPDFQAVVSKAKGVANKEKQHAPAGTKAKQAQDAAKSPASEVESKAQGNQVGEMEQAPTPGFNAAAFKAKLMERIKEAAPKNLDEADNFKNNNKLGGVKSEMQDRVKQEQTASQTPLEEKTKQTPDTSGIEPKLVTPLPPNEAGAATQNIDAQKAVPKAKGQSEVEAPLQESSQKLDQQMAEADVTEEQLAKSNEPQFQAALGAKQEASANAKQAPQEYRKFEQNQLTQAKGENTATAEQKLQGMHGSRAKLLSQVTNQQVEAKGKDEQERAKVAGDIQKIYQDTKTKVETALNSLDSKVQQAFDSGAAEAQKAFEDYVDKEMEAYKEERYSGAEGALLWTRDLFLDLPSEVNVFYQKGRKLYLQKMDVVLDEVVNIIGNALTNAKAEIANGKNRIQEYVAQLPQNLQTLGKEAATDIQGQFDELEQSVDSKQDELINTLAQKYNEKLQAVDSRIEEMKAANQGFVSKASNSRTGVINTINKLKDMLLSVLGKASGVIGNIIKDPISFLGNLISGIKQGFDNFVGNIGKHLQSGLIGWLTGTLGPMGIQMPDDVFSLPGIFSLVTQVLGVTFGHIRRKAVKRFGEPVVAGMEQSVEVFQVLRDRGAMGLWEQAQEQFSDLKETVIGEIKNMVITQVITAGVKWILSLLNPASAFVKAAMAIYDIIMFFVNRGKQVLELVNAVVDAVAAIAKGAVGGAAKLVENALSRALPVVIGFLASLLGIGGLAKKVEKIIGKVRKRIDKAIDKVLLKAKRLFKRKKGKGNKDKEGKEDEKDHNALAKQAASELKQNSQGKDYETLRKEKEAQAKTIESKYTNQLEQGVKLTIKFSDPAQDTKDGDLDFQVRIAPNDTVKKDSINVNDNQDIEKAKSQFQSRLFTRDELQETLSISKSTALARIEKWKGENKLYTLASSSFDPLTQYSFDKDKGGQRELIDNETNRSKYGFINPPKESSTGLIILSKGINPSSPKPILYNDKKYHKTKAKYDSKRPGSSYQNFQFKDAILGHKDPGCSGYWNREGHKKSKAENKAWCKDQNNYWGPEHKKESSASGGKSERYRVPSKAIDSHPDWF